MDPKILFEGGVRLAISLPGEFLVFKFKKFELPRGVDTSPVLPRYVHDEFVYQ